MNRYPLWKYLTAILSLIIGCIYALPNFFGEAPAVQISAAKATVKIDLSLQKEVHNILSKAGITPAGIFFENPATGSTIKVKLANLEEQLRTKDVLDKVLNQSLDKDFVKNKVLNQRAEDHRYTVALNLLPASPKILTSMGALPMYLGLDLRGGVHFLLQVDILGALTKYLDSLANDARSLLRANNIRHNGINRNGQILFLRFTNNFDAKNALKLLRNSSEELEWVEIKSTHGTTDLASDLMLQAHLNDRSKLKIQEAALKQNISTLHNRVNELGVAEPVIQQQGIDRIIVQLPGMQDTAKAKEIIGRTATLEARLVDLDVPRLSNATELPIAPIGSELFTQGRGSPVVLKKQVIFSGERIINAAARFDQQLQAAVSIQLDAKGGAILREVSRENIGKPMAIVLFEKGKGEVLTVANIVSELGTNFEITGSNSAQEANDLALLLRAGSLAAPMEIIEERTIGPSLGAANIKKGLHSVIYGFAVIAIFMLLYYQIFGLFSVLALSLNLILLVAALSMLQATLTLPGIAAMALTLGMAIDANVLINERIREELRLGASPQTAISQGFGRAWSTILDSNITTLIAGLALLAFGSGPVRGFAVVHCLGILTSMFSAVFFARCLVNFYYGRKKKLQNLAIGQIWKPS